MKAADDPAFQGEDDYVPSPCRNVCVMNEESGYCLGCWRTIDEIMEWGVMPAEDKRRVLRHIEIREREPRAAEGG